MKRSKQKHGTGTPHPIDVHVARRLRQRRFLLGISQTKLGEGIGVTFQQVQKYEKGTNRISASKLYAISQHLHVPVSFFFEGVRVRDQSSGHAHTQGLSLDQMGKRETLTLVRLYYAIPDQGIRRRVLELIKAMGGSA